MNLIKLVDSSIDQLKICNNCKNKKTTCSKYQVEEKPVWSEKKDFKIWSYCYKIVKCIFK